MLIEVRLCLLGDLLLAPLVPLVVDDVAGDDDTEEQEACEEDEHRSHGTEESVIEATDM